ncbi:hypothetical protein [Sulfurifustis variabilis]|uniref:hypothetical protein n=1 Tax=Sulfurifustis variabilis TaxID=1675686 RepID=UPI0014755BFB|nr:hypothetical protein [Sulfurifustis variabilis]
MTASGKKGGSTGRRRVREKRQARKTGSVTSRRRGAPEAEREEAPRPRYRLLWW